jgi:hypothetical protein
LGGLVEFVKSVNACGRVETETFSVTNTRSHIGNIPLRLERQKEREHHVLA